MSFRTRTDRLSFFFEELVDTMPSARSFSLAAGSLLLRLCTVPDALLGDLLACFFFSSSSLIWEMMLAFTSSSCCIFLFNTTSRVFASALGQNN